MPGDPISDSIINITNIIAYIGICLILFFIGLILFSKKNRTIEGYFSAVASNSIVDLIFSISTAIIKMDSTYKNGFYIFAINRFDYELQLTLPKIIVMADLFMGHMCLYVVSIPFYIRYSLICKKRNVPYTIRTLLYLLVITYDIGTCSLLYASYETSPRELVEVQMKPYLKGNEKGRYWNFIGARIVSSEYYHKFSSWKYSLFLYIIINSF